MIDDTVTAIVVTDDTTPRAQELDVDDPATPAVGKWYWVNGKSERWLGCVVHIGTNYARLKGTRWTKRVHLDHFHETCALEPDPDGVIGGYIGTHQQRTHELMEKVKEVTARLGVGASPALMAGSETQALTLRRNEPMDAYKASLIKAKDETLPQLFSEIKAEHAAMAMWMKARLIPMKAQAHALKPAIKQVEDRIFSVQLYAGLTEEIVQIANGAPAPLTTKIHLFQRRAYMDEECLAAYETGGMEFTEIEDFDKWIKRKANRDRLLPFPRCILAFQVRRHRKEREYKSWYDYIKFAHLDEQNRLTFLYMRNGEQLFRLATEIRFEHQLFPDEDERTLLTGKLWAHTHAIDQGDDDGSRTVYIGSDRDDADDREADTSGNHVDRLVSDPQYQGIRDSDRERYEAWKKAVPEARAKRAAWLKEQKKLPRDKREWWSGAGPQIPNEPHPHADSYRPFDRENLFYDDISNYIQKRIAAHNRLVLVLQGILDRSPVMHPHPPWVLWNADSFLAALTLIYDDGRALVSGDPPDFAAYRAKCNASIKVGTLTLGQERAWHGYKKDYDEDEDVSASLNYRPRGGGRQERYRNITDPGPGKFAHVAKMGRGDVCVFEWVRTQEWWDRESSERRSRQFASRMRVPRARLFNVEAYTPGDFKQFFADPRTRENYLKWAPLLLEAEEFHAGNRKDKVRAPEKMPEPKRRTPGGSFEYQERKRKLALVGMAVRLRADVSMHRGGKYKKGTLWRVEELERGGAFLIGGINKDGTPTENDNIDKDSRRRISGMREYSFTVDESIPPEPKDRR